MAQPLVADVVDAVDEPVFPEYRWTPEQFLRAWEAGIFEGQRVELLDGRIVPVAHGDWPGETAAGLIRILPNGTAKVTMSTLASKTSLPDPDVWVRRTGAQPKAQLSKQLKSWHAEDVLLVVEVSNSSELTDLGFKARLYGSSGYAEYWVVTPDGVYVHRRPASGGYLSIEKLLPGSGLPVPYAPDVTLSVSELIGA